ncbi:MAG TPA: hypothetical protein VKQ36_05265, partial [Ktedonobacterales bacterium]|nr:hypothetical protein [Ktedonobacterales bacterium]
MEPFDPERLTPVASLNRVRIFDLPGLAFDPQVSGKTAHELLSARQVARAIRENAPSLALVAYERADDATLLRQFDHCFVDDDPSIREAAIALARRFGRYLAYLILTLKRGDLVN